jgi:LysM repeat protein
MSKARHARPRRSKTAVRALFTAGLGAGLSAGLAVTATGTAAASGDYTVKKGDTLSEIAQRYNTSWQRLARINQLGNPDLILIGQELELRGPLSADRPRTQKTTATTKRTKTERRTERRKTERTERRASRPERRSSSSRGSSSISGGWGQVAKCESGGNPRAVNPAGYYGLFQFDRRTWRSVGGSGNPANASSAEQLMRAKRLYAQRGSSPWPNCGRYLR